jgi:hypothetical protein
MPSTNNYLTKISEKVIFYPKNTEMKLCKLLLGTYKKQVEHRVHVTMKRNVSGKDKAMVQQKKIYISGKSHQTI